VKRAAFVGLAILLAACQGSIGSTPPVSAPAIPANAQGAVPGVGGPGASRAKTSEAAVKYSKDLAAVSFPVTEGYGLQIVLNPAASPSASPLKGQPVASASASASAAASGAASAEPSPSASAAPSAAPSASPKGKKSPAPAIAVKLSVYPDLVQVAPTPDIDTDASPAPTPLADRPAIVRGYFKSPVTLSASSLDAFRFTVPQDELGGKRGFTIALFAVPEKNQTAHALFGGQKELSTRIAFTTAAVVDPDGTIHAGIKGDAITISAGQGYTAVLYGDLRAVAAPAGAVSSFGSPSALPFGASPGASGQPPAQSLPVPYGQTSIPAVTPTPGGIRSN
jgi:hypothetical protein